MLVATYVPYLCIQGSSVDESGTLLHSLEGYITLIVQLSGIDGDVNKPRPRAVALRLGWFTAINP